MSFKLRYLAVARVCFLTLLILGVFVPVPFQTVLAEQQTPIKHVVIIFQENHTFDNYFGTYPGANGVSQASALPISRGSNVMVAPFHLLSTSTSDLDHSHAVATMDYDNGKMDGFVYSEGSNLTMGYYNGSDIPYYWDYASKFVLMDNYFSSVMGPSLPQHLYSIAGQSGGILDNVPFCLNITVIMDELNNKDVTWKYYYGGGNDSTLTSFWNPLPSCSSAENSSRINHILNNDQFFSDVAHNNLSSVSWVIPLGGESEHPPNNITTGEDTTVSIVNHIMQSQYWSSTAIFVTWDDYGGWYDHVSPPQVDAFGYGFRVPCLIISPYSKEGFIDNTLADHTSILKFIETVWSLPSLTSRDAAANNLLEAFNFNQTPRSPLILPGTYVPNSYPLILKDASSGTNLTITIVVTVIVAVVFILSILLLFRLRKVKKQNSTLSRK